MPSREDRLNLIKKLQRARGGSKVITYLTSTRNGLDVSMAMDVIPLFHEHLSAISFPDTKDRRIDIFVYSNGGDGTVPWRLISLVREYCDSLAVLVPSNAYSAATLLTLGADEVIMHPMGTLGPTDPTVTTPFNPTHPLDGSQLLGVSVEDVAAFIALVKEDVGIRHEDELIQAFLSLADQVSPLALGAVKRSTSQSRLIAQKLLRRRNGNDLDGHQIGEIIELLTSELYFHGHPINRVEARELGLTFVSNAEPGVESLMWELFAAYAEDLDLGTPFDPVRLAYAHSQQIGRLPSNGSVHVELITPPPLNVAYIESEAVSHTSEMEFEMTLIREANGAMSVKPWQKRLGWVSRQ